MDTRAKRLRRSSQPDAVFPYEDAMWFRNLLGVRTDEGTAEIQTELRAACGSTTTRSYSSKFITRKGTDVSVIRSPCVRRKTEIESISPGSKSQIFRFINHTYHP